MFSSAQPSIHVLSLHDEFGFPMVPLRSIHPMRHDFAEAALVRTSSGGRRCSNVNAMHHDSGAVEQQLTP
jgi:hypothetical protein